MQKEYYLYNIFEQYHNKTVKLIQCQKKNQKSLPLLSFLTFL